MRDSGMKKIMLTVFGMMCWAQGQTNAPAVPVSVPPAQQAAPTVTQELLVQPSRLEGRIAPGNKLVNIGFTVFSRTATEIYVKSSDPRLLISAGENGKVRVGANVLQNINCVVTEPHSGTLTITNADGAVLATLPYRIDPPKVVNQSASLGYNVFGKAVSAGYSLSNVPESPLDPGWSLNFGIGYDFNISRINSGTVGVSVRW
ncbi:hypothetical protein [Deinococcus aquiradiocola]|uniref:Uncharacterized protein n=1 Tax=Deinococcus aquiradiocola TaxID=393059 RepID=A0A917PG59_9DEIO|nr:hypothetical protein [Deinococcus aquiradiocola]GGJ75824.1 hypothetical protein GCM10008939_20080 [Deinococcus aquiradiocola]